MADGALNYYLLEYDVVADYVSRRAPLREAHLALAHAAVARGELMLGGALGEPPDGVAILFRGAGPEVAHTFVAADPYVAHGLVTSWRVRRWHVAAGTHK